jgi:hypothetical protein
MQQYINAGIYILLGLMGATAHWFKKRYKDQTTKDSFVQYVLGNFPYTLYTVGCIIFAESGLSLAQAGNIISLSELIGALTMGYGMDSGINKASDTDFIKMRAEPRN